MVGLNSTNTEGENYVKKLYAHLQSNNVISKTSVLLESINKNTHNHEAAIKQLDGIDESVTNAMIKIERKSCKKKEPVLWTPKVRQLNLRLQYWSMRVKSSKQRIDADQRLRNLLEK
jgi:hypothetical protein